MQLNVSNEMSDWLLTFLVWILFACQQIKFTTLVLLNSQLYFNLLWDRLGVEHKGDDAVVAAAAAST